MNEQRNQQFDNTIVPVTSLNDDDIKKHRFDCLLFADAELVFAGESTHSMFSLNQLEARFRRTFKLGSVAVQTKYGPGESIFPILL